MSDYRPPFKITKEILTLVSAVCAKIEEIEALKETATNGKIGIDSQIRAVYATLKIEGSNLALKQVEEIINGKPVAGDRDEIQAVQNAYAAYGELLTIDPYDIHEFKEIHGIMMKHLLKESGVFRQREEGVFSGERCIFMAPPAKFVSALMAELFAWLQSAQAQIHPLILSSVFHYESVFIHPFADGNGRMARLWQRAILTNRQPIFADIPFEIELEKCRKEYYQVIAKCHAEGESTLFIEFMLRRIDRILTDLSFKAPTEQFLCRLE